ncbi:unnamed protein product [Didymodactylos carnosus]|uniref:NAD(P)(+)--arginine ADP-ribosyltransferase n=1 Tax=Didymodactylos carnosus TaxID=1234261 RepID=A0A814XU07_9BILA|nr:unnamed protein product [Didymodactylos carnosus]CAF3983768.1 unnamed protein product [Didymodactylos carnosus]
MSRSVVEIIQDLTLFNPVTAEFGHRLAHDCYMILVGCVKDKEHLEMLQAMVISRERTKNWREKEAAARAAFNARNTLFKIYSLTGRSIKQFSNYPDEDEVLFLPHSTFLVFKHVASHHGSQHTIYMRQVELGLSVWSVLWVDDRIFNEHWENKRHMEYASAKALNMNVHFIPKSSTDSALSFLRSPFGQRLKNKDKFRIVTDMNREYEQPSHNAGARLIKALRRMGFRNECMIFTSDKREADQIIKSELNSRDQQFVTVTTEASDLQTIVDFDQEPRYTHHPEMGNSRTPCIIIS